MKNNEEKKRLLCLLIGNRVQNRDPLAGLVDGEGQGVLEAMQAVTLAPAAQVAQVHALARPHLRHQYSHRQGYRVRSTISLN